MVTEDNFSLSCLAVNERNFYDIWYLDSGCSNQEIKGYLWKWMIL